jgi:hypothetical protein
MIDASPVPEHGDDERHLAALVEERVQIDHEVIVINEATWAIHGSITYDGQVIAATFGTAEEAWSGLARLEELEHGHGQ